MPIFEEHIQWQYDTRIGTLARIKARSFGADNLTLVALTVLAYAQLEGGVKDLASTVIRDINARKLQLGQVAPRLLKWRNLNEIERFKSKINFDMLAVASPFAAMLTRAVRINGINRRYELNQMSWAGLKGVYNGLGLDCSNVEKVATQIDDLVEARNNAAHHGIPQNIAATLLENQLRMNVLMVEDVLTDLSLQLLPFFTNKMHLR